MIVITPFVGPLNGVVFTTNVVPSISKSPASVKSPVAGVPSSVMVFVSLSTIGGQFGAIDIEILAPIDTQVVSITLLTVIL